MALLVIYQSRFFVLFIAHRQIIFLFLNLFYARAADGLIRF